jgi:hypothetical protein
MQGHLLEALLLALLLALLVLLVQSQLLRPCHWVGPTLQHLQDKRALSAALLLQVVLLHSH